MAVPPDGGGLKYSDPSRHPFFLSAAFAMIYRILDFNFLGTLGLDGFWKTTILIICRLVRVLQLYSPEPLEGLKTWGGQSVIQDLFIKQVLLVVQQKSGQISRHISKIIVLGPPCPPKVSNLEALCPPWSDGPVYILHIKNRSVFYTPGKAWSKW